ncbi:hypothetical protein F5B20DRAFT_575893 [Whalleya microplaca]|nr:hypothetical protein F5B20DRAFT_575893 [Whalleya microplaca]
MSHESLPMNGTGKSMKPEASPMTLSALPLGGRHREYTKITQLNSRQCDKCKMPRYGVMYQCNTCGHTTCKVCHTFRRYDNRHVLDDMGLDWEKPQPILSHKKQRPVGRSLSRSISSAPYRKILPRAPLEFPNTTQPEPQAVSSNTLKPNIHATDSVGDNNNGGESPKPAADDDSNLSEHAKKCTEAFIVERDFAWYNNPHIQKERQEKGDLAAIEMLKGACKLIFLQTNRGRDWN